MEWYRDKWGTPGVEYMNTSCSHRWWFTRARSVGDAGWRQDAKDILSYCCCCRTSNYCCYPFLPNIFEKKNKLHIRRTWYMILVWFPQNLHLQSLACVMREFELYDTHTYFQREGVHLVCSPVCLLSTKSCRYNTAGRRRRRRWGFCERCPQLLRLLL